MLDAFAFGQRRVLTGALGGSTVGRWRTVSRAPRGCEKGMLEATRDAGLLVVGLSTRWHREWLGAARLRLARDATPPTLLVRSGLRPGGLAPPPALTRFTWSIRP